MTKQRPVIAAIPNYNMAESLRRLLPQVLKQRYDAIYVLDDHSTDDSVTAVEHFAGVLVYEKTGLQSPYNFGPRISLTWIGALIPQVIAEQRALRMKRNRMGHPPKGRKDSIQRSSRPGE